MSRILLVDDSPHAQRMGERILTEEGFEVVTVSNADSALIRLDDVDPDVVLADTVMPGRTGYDICQYLKMSPRHKHVRVILTAGALEPLDEDNVKRVEADATLKKPFEASVLIAAVKPLAEAATAARAGKSEPGAAGPGDHRGASGSAGAAPFIAVIDAEQVRAAVTVALDAAMENMVDEITRRVLLTIQSKKPGAQGVEPAPHPALHPAPHPVIELAPHEPAKATMAQPAMPQPAAPQPVVPLPGVPQPAVPQPGVPRVEPVRRVSAVRMRSSSILGLDIHGLDIRRPEPEGAGPAASPPGPRPTAPGRE